MPENTVLIPVEPLTPEEDAEVRPAPHPPIQQLVQRPLNRTEPDVYGYEPRGYRHEQ